jgi:hypothetical protein
VSSDREAAIQLFKTSIEHLGTVIQKTNHETQDERIGIKGFKMMEAQQLLHIHDKAPLSLSCPAEAIDRIRD